MPNWAWLLIGMFTGWLLQAVGMWVAHRSQHPGWPERTFYHDRRRDE